MMILVRKKEESLILKTPYGKQIKVLILGTKNGHAKIGVNALPYIEILRDELLKTGKPVSRSVYETFILIV